MSKKKWFALTACAVLLIPLLCALFPRSNSSLPKNEKTAYLSEHPDEFDSYVLGSSSGAAFRPETLEEYYGGKFYNLFHEGSDTRYDRQLAQFLLAHGKVKTMVLVLGLEDAQRQTEQGADPFQPLGALLPQRGIYDTRLPDAQPIDTPQGDAPVISELQPAAIADCAANVAEIRRMCQQSGTELVVILSPVFAQAPEPQELDEYFKALSDVTDYWNFSLSPLSYDMRYFYDAAHPRTATGDMVLARIAEDSSHFYPDGFGVYCQKGTCVDTKTLRERAESAPAPAERGVRIPILLYHHLDPNQPETENSIHPDTFRRHMRLLKKKGFTTVTYDDLLAYVEQGKPLPRRPVVVNFDDGYTSNYTYAYPILRELGQRATIFTIGVSLGHDRYYKDTQHELTPHFGQREIDEMLQSGVITLGSHTYDMHQWPPFENHSPARATMLPFPDESDEAYMQAVITDDQQQKAAFEAFGIPKPLVLAFPQGAHTPLTDVALRECGYKITVTTDASRVNTILPGLPQSLIDLGRLTVLPTITDEQLLQYLLVRTS